MIAQALSRNLSISVVNHASGAHGFDIDEDSDMSRAVVEQVLAFAAEQVVPRLAATTGELDAVLHALDGGYIPAGPSGSPLRGGMQSISVTSPSGVSNYVSSTSVPGW